MQSGKFRQKSSHSDGPYTLISFTITLWMQAPVIEDIVYKFTLSCRISVLQTYDFLRIFPTIMLFLAVHNTHYIEMDTTFIQELICRLSTRGPRLKLELGPLWDKIALTQPVSTIFKWNFYNTNFSSLKMRLSTCLQNNFKCSSDFLTGIPTGSMTALCEKNRRPQNSSRIPTGIRRNI